MKRIVTSIFEQVFKIKIHANHLQIKGKKSGGYRDLNGTDYNTNKYK
jgi:hypothetical protein